MPEKEYIEREALIEQITSKFQEHYGNTNYQFIKDFYRFVIRRITRMPTADVAEVKHGEWKDTEYGFCSVCDRSISEIYDADSSMAYGILDELTACPFCGAKMDGAKND